MARLVRMEGKGPIRIDPQEKPVFICGCGLTKKTPFCDGTHKACVSEEDGVLYRYDPESGRAVSVKDD
jgi:CDGSH-type Zn-finger protein